MKAKNTYPKDWHAIRHREYERANWTCEHCGTRFMPGSTLHPAITRQDGKPLVLTIHHLDGDRANNQYTNLLVVCQSCHLHIQGVWKPGGTIPWSKPPAWLIARNLAYDIQLTLWGDQ